MWMGYLKVTSQIEILVYEWQQLHIMRMKIIKIWYTVNKEFVSNV